jgi:hypothetical protein
VADRADDAEEAAVGGRQRVAQAGHVRRRLLLPRLQRTKDLVEDHEDLEAQGLAHRARILARAPQ